MHGHSFKRKVRIQNPQGFHLRPVTAFVEMARDFQSDVSISKDNHRVDGKGSPIELLLLEAPQGTELELETTGPDAPEALHALGDLLERPTFSDE